MLNGIAIGRDAIKHNHISSCRVAQAIGKLVDEHPIVAEQRGFHRGASDVVLLHHEGTQQGGNNHGNNDDGYPLANLTPTSGDSLLLAGRAFSHRDHAS